jgi:hypothetical protein
LRIAGQTILSEFFGCQASVGSEKICKSNACGPDLDFGSEYRHLNDRDQLARNEFRLVRELIEQGAAHVE